MNTEIKHVEPMLRYNQIITDLDNLEKDWETAKARKEEMETRLLDISHFMEELIKYTPKKLTTSQCVNLVDLITDYLQIRRDYKQEEILYDTMENNKAKLGYANQRGMLLAELYKKEKSLQTDYKPRILQYDEIWDMITTSKGRKPVNPFRETEEK